MEGLVKRKEWETDVCGVLTIHLFEQGRRDANLTQEARSGFAEI